LVTHFYKKLLTDDESWVKEPDLLEHPFPRLAANHITKLGRPYRSNKVWNALKGMSSYKAPSANGFQALFFRGFWNMVGDSVIQMVLGALKGQALPITINHTYLTLILKVENPQFITQVRPIGLCNVNYKLVTKVIVE